MYSSLTCHYPSLPRQMSSETKWTFPSVNRLIKTFMRLWTTAGIAVVGWRSHTPLNPSGDFAHLPILWQFYLRWVQCSRFWWWTPWWICSTAFSSTVQPQPFLSVPSLVSSMVEAGHGENRISCNAWLSFTLSFNASLNHGRNCRCGVTFPYSASPSGDVKMDGVPITSEMLPANFDS